MSHVPSRLFYCYNRCVLLYCCGRAGILVRTYEYPLTVIYTANTGDGGPAVEVPLDGTVYDLESGKVPICLHKFLRDLLNASVLQIDSGHCALPPFCRSSDGHTFPTPWETSNAYQGLACMMAYESGCPLQVLEWCPRNNPVRFLLGALKASSCLLCLPHAARHKLSCMHARDPPFGCVVRAIKRLD